MTNWVTNSEMCWKWGLRTEKRDLIRRRAENRGKSKGVIRWQGVGLVESDDTQGYQESNWLGMVGVIRLSDAEIGILVRKSLTLEMLWLAKSLVKSGKFLSRKYTSNHGADRRRLGSTRRLTEEPRQEEADELFPWSHEDQVEPVWRGCGSDPKDRKLTKGNWSWRICLSPKPKTTKPFQLSLNLKDKVREEKYSSKRGVVGKNLWWWLWRNFWWKVAEDGWEYKEKGKANM